MLLIGKIKEIVIKIITYTLAFLVAAIAFLVLCLVLFTKPHCKGCKYKLSPYEQFLQDRRDSYCELRQPRYFHQAITEEQLREEFNQGVNRAVSKSNSLKAKGLTNKQELAESFDTYLKRNKAKLTSHWVDVGIYLDRHNACAQSFSPYFPVPKYYWLVVF